MLFRAAADLVILLHVAFVVFVVMGALLVTRWPRLACFHVPAVAWGALIEFRGWVCPLTPLENYLRERGGSTRYEGEFIEHYILPLLYPANLTAHVQIWLGALAVMINIALYWRAFRRTSHKRGRSHYPGTHGNARIVKPHGKH
jgi:Protein of Unknown function (DUF2784)